MRITFICIGKTTQSFLVSGEQEYLKRLTHYCKVERIELADLKNNKNMQRDQIKKEEGKMFLSRIDSNDYVILLDERGKQYGSIEFADFIENRQMEGTRNMVFIVGGAFGFSDEIYQRANSMLSLSKMTFSHQMIRMLFFEQLYRAHTIIRKEPYHHAD